MFRECVITHKFFSLNIELNATALKNCKNRLNYSIVSVACQTIKYPILTSTIKTNNNDFRTCNKNISEKYRNSNIIMLLRSTWAVRDESTKKTNSKYLPTRLECRIRAHTVDVKSVFSFFLYSIPRLNDWFKYYFIY